MAKKLLAIIRVVFLYATFGLICLIGDLLFIIVVSLGLNKFIHIRKFCRELVRISWAFFIQICIFTGYLRIDFNASELGKSGELIIANHPSLLDVVFFLSRVKNLNCVVKAELGSNIFLAFAIKACGYISNADNERLLELSLNSLNNGESLLIFPEGTRTKQKIIFHKAPFFIAIKSAKKVTPVIIKMHPQTLKKYQKWYDVPNKTIKYNFIKKPSIDIDSYNKNRPDPVRIRLLLQETIEIYKELR